MGYKIDFTEREIPTIIWLSNRGYDAGIYDAYIEHDGDIPEHVAWEIKERYDEDPYAFLTCCGDRGLADKLIKFIDSIV